MSKLLETANLWLNPLGYSIMQRSADCGWANYVNINKKASIEVYYKNDEMMCKGCGFLGQTFNSVQTMEYSLGNRNLFRQLDAINLAIKLYDQYQ